MGENVDKDEHWSTGGKGLGFLATYPHSAL